MIFFKILNLPLESSFVSFLFCVLQELGIFIFITVSILLLLQFLVEDVLLKSYRNSVAIRKATETHDKMNAQYNF